MRIRNLKRRFADDPFLKVGIAAMTLALAIAGVVVFIVFLEEPQRAVAARSAKESTAEPLVRSDPAVKPWVEKDIPQPEPRSGPSSGQTGSALPREEAGYPLPTQKQLEAANHPRRYHLPEGAIMGLTIKAIDLHNVPVLDSDRSSALDQGVVHLPDTSLPWSNTPERNVYLAGHRLGWPSTGSYLVFYRLDELKRGDEISLRDRQGRRYDYRVLESFTVNPDDNWVTGRVRGRDLLTLQTCTPIPTFQKRLIVRAERI